jgi:hypothetical protein
MENFTMAELGVFIGILGGVLTTFMLTCQKSRCREIDLKKCICSRVVKIEEPVPPPEPEPES